MGMMHLFSGGRERGVGNKGGRRVRGGHGRGRGRNGPFGTSVQFVLLIIKG